MHFWLSFERQEPLASSGGCLRITVKAWPSVEWHEEMKGVPVGVVLRSASNVEANSDVIDRSKPWMWCLVSVTSSAR